MFKRLAKQLIQELDSDGRLIPMTSLARTNSFRPLSLVTKEQSRWPWHAPKYSPIPFKLSDILQEGATMEIELKHSEQLLISANMYHKSGARLNLKIQSTEVDIGGLGSACLSASPVSVRKTYVDPKELWKIETSLDLIQEIYPKLSFYVVVEVFEIMEPVLIEETVQGGGKGEVAAVEIIKIQGLAVRMKKKCAQIPRGTVFAYVVEKLRSPKEDLTLLFQKTRRKSISSLTYDAFQDDMGSSFTAVQQVKDTVKEAYEPLMSLSQTLKRLLLESLGIFLQDGDVAVTVQSMLELAQTGDSVDRSMLESLNEELRPPVEKLLSLIGIFEETEKRDNQDLCGPVHFLCSSIDDLDYETLPLLEIVLEKKNAAQQLEMMDSILEWILSGDEGSVFTSPDHPLMNEDTELTTEMLQTCGLVSETGKDSITYLWNSKPRSELAALYSSLYALHILSE
ncbi:gasdermin-D-like [Hemicordylus capensis]|uniref:gasdermin-D-like n=1 Tax=Hemicordylus capensis TaxID=884348 RepID=UPI0023045246|nr:gasdermin-D-like [Hemicordylus capensis]XP_053121193.1 gasdermin-D-like [Hemicordylus capensis]